jgi:alkanesulfonate monooxygenase SsuD/methylene tetrahydromethanopterin reductase-like flavin-dependent oxidoreductase (luciferase family)
MSSADPRIAADTGQGGRATEFGASIFFTDYSITPAKLAVALEERGFDSVWAAEHLHIPVPRRRRRRAATSCTIAITK